MSNPTTPFSWQMPTATDLVTDLPADFEVFGQAVATSMADLLGGTTGQVLAKNSNTDMDFVWSSPNPGDITAVTAGTGITGGGTSGDVTVSFDQANFGGGQYAAGKNLVFNSNLNIAQRGTSSAAVVNNYTIDRWNNRNNNLGVFTVSQDTDAPAGFKTSGKWLCTTADASPAASDFMIYRQSFEGQGLQILKKGSASALTTTVSFWVKSNLTGTYILNLTDQDNTRQISKSYTISVADTWEKKSISFAGDTSGVLDNDANSSMQLQFFLGVGSDRSSGTLQTTWAASVNANTAVGQTNLAATLNNYWMVTGVQWEIGDTATNWQLMTGNIATELAACQRYYEKSYNTDVTPATTTDVGAIGMFQDGSTSTNNQGQVYYKISKRTTPTFTVYSPVGGATANVYNTKTGANVAATALYNGASNSSFYTNIGTVGTGYSGKYHFTAEAEL